jgi:hypothetical protein
LTVSKLPAKYHANVLRRFESRVPRTCGCWVWAGQVDPRYGYGECYLWWIGGVSKHIRAHRLAWIIKYGSIPRGMCVCHKCDNRLCVRPSHLFLGTNLENNQDMSRKGRSRGNPTGCRDKITAREVATMRKEYASGVSYSSLARKYGVTRWSASRIVRRKLRP